MARAVALGAPGTRLGNWFYGDNQLHQILYNPSTGGCYDGLETDHVNLNQGAESTLSYLMARLAMEKTFHPKSAMEETDNTLRGRQQALFA